MAEIKGRTISTRRIPAPHWTGILLAVALAYLVAPFIVSEHASDSDLGPLMASPPLLGMLLLITAGLGIAVTSLGIIAEVHQRTQPHPWCRVRNHAIGVGGLLWPIAWLLVNPPGSATFMAAPSLLAFGAGWWLVINRQWWGVQVQLWIQQGFLFLLVLGALLRSGISHCCLNGL